MPIHYSLEGSIATLIFCRPEVCNAFDTAHLESFLNALKRAEDDGVRGLILTGEGAAFSAGADITELAKKDSVEMREFCARGLEVTAALEQGPFLTVAAINGNALGGGLEIALACDYLFAVPQVRLGLPEVKLGLIPGWGGVHRLIRAIGYSKAKKLVLEGTLLFSEEALTLGLIHAIYSAAELMERCRSKLYESLNVPFSALMAVKAALRDHGTIPLDQRYSHEGELCAKEIGSSGAQEKLMQFIKR